jgi:hypothetical protein
MHGEQYLDSRDFHFYIYRCHKVKQLRVAYTFFNKAGDGNYTGRIY